MNLLFWLQSSYFAGPSEAKPLLHTWSLGVEEQFYLLFPILLAASFRFGRKPMIAMIIVLALASLFLSERLSTSHASANFFLSPSRVWELLTGTLCAFLLKDGHVAANDKLAFGGLLLLSVSVLSFDSHTPSPSLITLAPVIGTALLIVFARVGTHSAKFLSHQWFVGLGLVSYSAYLWHQPLFAFARLRSGELSAPSVVGLVLATFCLAYLSWRFVEQPFRVKSVLKSRTRVFVASALATAVFAMLGAMIYIGNGLPSRVAPSGVTFADLRLDERTKPNIGLNADCDSDFTVSKSCRTSDRPEVLLWGDSHAMHLAQALRASQPGLQIIQHTMSVCSPILGFALTNLEYSPEWSKTCIANNAKVIASLSTVPSIRYAILSSPFEISVSDVVDREGRVTRDGNFPRTLAGLRYTVETLRAAGIRPVIVSSPPATDSNTAHCLIRRETFGDSEDCRIKRQSFGKQFRASLKFLEAASRFVPVIRLDHYLCGREACLTSSGATFLYNDGHHLSAEGSHWLGRQVPLMQLVRSKGDGFAQIRTAGGIGIVRPNLLAG